MRATRARIHLDNLKGNIKAIRSLLTSGTMLCTSVKADAYGHGAVPCARAAVEAGADMLAIATPQEGQELRENGITVPLLMLSLCTPEDVAVVMRNKITPLVFDAEYIGLFADAARQCNLHDYPVHLAVDTGMGRIGVLPQEAATLAQNICSTGMLALGGICTHFAVSDSVTKEDRLYTQVQFSRFIEAVEAVKKAGINPGICHCANSAATLACPEMHLDMVRPGIIIYGYYADEVTESYLHDRGISIHLEPVMTLESQVSAIRPFTKGQSVGYGRTWKADAPTDIAVLPIGYGDGMLRSWATQGIQVAINGKNYPVRGRICMDQCMVDIGKDSGIKRWDRAVIFGTEADGALQTAQDIARLTGTIPYEITTCLSKRVERVFME